MSQNLDIDAFRKAYYARTEGQEESGIEQNLERLAGMAGYVPPEAEPSTQAQGESSISQNLERLAGMAAYVPPDVQEARQDTTGEPGMALPAEKVAEVFAEWKTPIEARAEYEASTLGETLDAVELPDEETFALKALNETALPDARPFSISPGNGMSPGDMDIHLARMRHRGVIFDRRSFDWNLQTVHALHNSLKTNAFELKRLADRSELPYSVVEDDPDFARKKILSDEHAERLRLFAQKNEIPNTIDFLRQRDPVEQVALTSDVALAALEKDLPSSERGFFETGYIGAARNAWAYGMMARELGNLGVKWMDGSITDEERARLDVLQKTLAYGHEQRKNQALLERMVRGTVESVGVPLYGGLEGSLEFLGRYGKEGLAGGAMLGAGIGSAAGGVGAVPGAIAGGLTGLGAVAQAGFVNDMARQEGAQTFLTLMDKGVPEELARVLAIGAGAAKGALEYVGLKQLGKVFPGAERFLTREAANAALAAIKKNPSLAAAVGEGALAFLRGVTGETATEVMQEGVDIAAEEAGRRLS
ncbi:MAG: hypothetical protein K2N07_08825, partial [Desulfovibrio sp.]|nr:hypothetical protein [Desulfovibrio sp.]